MVNIKIVPRLWAAAVLLLTTLAISESSAIAQCPAVGNNSVCGTIITITDGGFTVSHSNQGPYDTIDDTLVGVVNSSTTKTISSIGLRSGLPIFAFDGDGICGLSPLTGLPYIPRPNGCPFGPTGYEGPGVNFTNINSSLTEGTVNFAPPIAINGGTAFFHWKKRLVPLPAVRTESITLSELIPVLRFNQVSGIT
jgi:hypothetical protein